MNRGSTFVIREFVIYDMDFSNLNLQELAKTSGEWLRGSGPESDIVISSRIRLARNLADFPFISRATDTDRAEIGKILRGRIENLEPLKGLSRESGELSYRLAIREPSRPLVAIAQDHVEAYEYRRYTSSV